MSKDEIKLNENLLKQWWKSQQKLQRDHKFNICADGIRQIQCHFTVKSWLLLFIFNALCNYQRKTEKM